MNRVILLSATLLLLLWVWSCKPTEDNYRAAYELAREKEHDGLEDEIYEKIRLEAMPEIQVVGNDTIRIKVEPLSRVDENDKTSMLSNRYNVAVAQYKMLANAISHRDRLQTMGYENACMLKNSDEVYYVVIAGVGTAEEAASIVNQYQKKYPGQLVGMETPIVLQPSQLTRRL